MEPPFAALALIEIYDLETDELRGVLSCLDAFLADADPLAPGVAYARRQRECAALELDERGFSEMIAHVAQPLAPPPPAQTPRQRSPLTPLVASQASRVSRPAWLSPAGPLPGSGATAAEQQLARPSSTASATSSPNSSPRASPADGVSEVDGGACLSPSALVLASARSDAAEPEAAKPTPIPPRRVIPVWTAAQLDGRGTKPLRRKKAAAPKAGATRGAATPRGGAACATPRAAATSAAKLPSARVRPASAGRARSGAGAAGGAGGAGGAGRAGAVGVPARLPAESTPPVPRGRSTQPPAPAAAANGAAQSAAAAAAAAAEAAVAASAAVVELRGASPPLAAATQPQPHPTVPPLPLARAGLGDWKCAAGSAAGSEAGSEAACAQTAAADAHALPEGGAPTPAGSEAEEGAAAAAEAAVQADGAAAVGAAACAGQLPRPALPPGEPHDRPADNRSRPHRADSSGSASGDGRSGSGGESGAGAGDGLSSQSGSEIGVSAAQGAEEEAAGATADAQGEKRGSDSGSEIGVSAAQVAEEEEAGATGDEEAGTEAPVADAEATAEAEQGGCAESAARECSPDADALPPLPPLRAAEAAAGSAASAGAASMAARADGLAGGGSGSDERAGARSEPAGVRAMAAELAAAFPSAPPALCLAHAVAARGDWAAAVRSLFDAALLQPAGGPCRTGQSGALASRARVPRPRSAAASPAEVGSGQRCAAALPPPPPADTQAQAHSRQRRPSQQRALPQQLLPDARCWDDLFDAGGPSAGAAGSAASGALSARAGGAGSRRAEGSAAQLQQAQHVVDALKAWEVARAEPAAEAAAHASLRACTEATRQHSPSAQPPAPCDAGGSPVEAARAGGALGGGGGARNGGIERSASDALPDVRADGVANGCSADDDEDEEEEDDGYSLLLAKWTPDQFGLQQQHTQPPELQQHARPQQPQSPPSRLHGLAREPLYFKVHSTRLEVCEIVTDVLAHGLRGSAAAAAGCCGDDDDDGTSGAREAGGRAWVEAAAPEEWAGTWNLLWTWKQPRIEYASLLRFQRVNHFPRSSARVLSRKDLLKKALARCSKMHGAAFDIMPSTYALPQEYVPFVAEFAQLEHELGRARNLWILKPVGSSRGRGIRVLNDISAVNYSQEVVLQRYVHAPLTLGGRKFDLRVYVLLTSVRPLEAFVYTEGLARFASRPYCVHEDGLGDALIHLTNTAVQRHAPPEEHAAGLGAGDVRGDAATKCSFARLRARLHERGIAWEPLWARVCETVIRSLVAVEEAIEPHRCAFELFGYDVLIEEGSLRPWLIEVNASPSLERETALDADLKQQLIADTIALVDPPFFDRAVLRRMAEWRLAQAERGSKAASRTAAPPFERELHALLRGGTERRVGAMPRELGLYQRLVPSPFHERVTRNMRRPGAGGRAE